MRIAAVDVRAWVGIAGTWAIAILAIYGEKIRTALFKPKLKLELSNNLGERVRLDITETRDGRRQVVDSYLVRQYHVRVTNRSRVAAHEVQVLVTRLDLRGPDGQPQPLYDSAHLPLAWRLQEIYGTSRTIGHATAGDAGLLYVRPESLTITLIITPNNFPDRMSSRPSGPPVQHFWLTLVARGLETESEPLRLRVDWDGQWEDGDNEMRRHLTIVPG